MWNGERLVSATYFKSATSPSQTMNPAYGFLFWLNAAEGHRAGNKNVGYRFPGAPRDLIACLGARGQNIIAVPSEALVIVRQGEQAAGSFMRRCVQMVLAAIVGAKYKVEPRPRRAFARLDKNGDGKLDREEFAKSAIARRRAGLFDELDRDRDGFLTAEEARRR